MQKHITSAPEIEQILNQLSHSFQAPTDSSNQLILIYLGNSQPAPSFRKTAQIEQPTTRELEVLREICREKTNEEIAETLFISPKTVQSHRSSLRDKTGARNTAGLVIFAIRNGHFSLT